MKRRHMEIRVAAMLGIVASTAMAAEAPRISKADNYPHKSLRVIDPFAAAGASDVIARLVGQKFTERFGEAFVIDNRPGAGGNVAAKMAAEAPADGYTLMNVVVLSLAPSVSLYAQPGFDAMKDFAYITVLAGGSYVIVAQPSFPAKTIAELVALAKSQPGKIGYGSSGVGGPVHIAGELLKSRAGINLLHVPYKSNALMLPALLAGEIDVMFTDTALVIPHVKSGKLRTIAVTGLQRMASLPGVPTLKESGLPDYYLTFWFAAWVPAKTPAAVVSRINDLLARAARTQPVQAFLTNGGAENFDLSGEQFARFQDAEIAKFGKIVKAANIEAK